MKLTSSAFKHLARIPSTYTGDGEEYNPPLTIEQVPKGAQSLTLVIDDPDAVTVAGKVWDHWIVWNISPATKTIEENSVPEGAIQGKNSWNENKYGGPCPPQGEHRYVFRLYALDTNLMLSQTTTKKELEHAMKGHILEQTELVGVYKRER